MQVTRRPLAEAHSDIVAAFGPSSWPGVSAAWALAWAQSSADTVEVEALLCHRNDALVGIAILYRVPRLFVLRYVGGVFARVSAWLSARWRDPFTLSVVFVDLPYTDEEAVFVRADVRADDAGLVRDALIAAAVVDPRSGTVCIRATNGSPLDAACQRAALKPVPIIPGTRLTLEGSSDAWFAGRSANRRAQLRRDARRLARAGGRVVRIDASTPHAARLVELQSAVVAHALARGSIPVPVELRAAFCTGFDALPPGTRHLVAVELDGRIIAALFVIVAPGHRTLVGPCALDYGAAPDTRAYFCLWPEVVAIAAEAGCHEILFGSEAYAYKERLGAVTVGTAFRVAFGAWPLRLVSSVLLREISTTLMRAPDDEEPHVEQ